MKAFLKIACGAIAVLVAGLLLHDRDPARHRDPLDAKDVERNAEGRSDPESVESLRPVVADEWMAGTERDPVVADYRRLRDMGPAAKGEVDELLCRFRALLNPENAAEVVHSLSSDELATPLGSVALEAWLAADGGAASAWIAVQPGATEHHAWLVADVLAHQPENLAVFCERLGTDSWSQAFLDYCSREMLNTNPAAAVSLAESLIPGEQQARLFETIACEWMDRDPGAARAWIGGVSDPVLQQHLVEIGAQSYASTNPLSALEWLVAQSPANTVPREPLRTIAGIWLHTASPETVVWLNRLLANGDGRTDSVSGLP